jgi:hypothetical protein
MNKEFIEKMFKLNKQLNNYQLALMLKCEICGPIIRGADKSRYPKCKKHAYYER